MLYAIVAVIILILDQGLKYWASANLPFSVGEKALIPGVVHLTNYHNTGAAFSFLQGARWFFVVITVVFVVAVIVLLSMEIISGEFGRWMAVLVLAGAIGNGIDRALYGYVVDMIELEFVRFPIFNIADVFITVGGILFCVYILVHKPDKPKASEGETQKPARALGRRFSELARSAEAAEAGESAAPKAENIVPQRRARVVRMERPKAPDKAPAKRDADNPFAEWEDDAVQIETAAIDPRDVAVFTPPETPAAASAEAPAEAPEEAPVPPTEDEETLEFSLEDILAEFGGDK